MIGASASMIAIPAMPECLEAIEEKKEFNYNPDQVNNEISGIFVTSTGIGETIGPITSSFLNYNYSFTTS